ncbi:MAG: hypothetical protein Q9180_008282, partial [Flavoplaca navasiana]
MAGNSVSSTDEKLFRERGRAYRGSIGYPLRNLRFESQQSNPRQLDKKNVDRILAIFELQGCLRFEPENQIPALVSPAVLSAIVQRLPEGRALVGPPDNLSREVQKTLREDYANSKNFYDGDIYRHLRRAHLRGDLRSKKQWLARLSTTKQRDVKQFEKRATKSYPLRCFSDALDALIP